MLYRLIERVLFAFNMIAASERVIGTLCFMYHKLWKCSAVFREVILHIGTALHSCLLVEPAIESFNRNDVRALTNTQTVFIGKKPDNGGKSVAIDTLKPYSDSGFYTAKDAQFNVLDKTITPFNSIKGNYGTQASGYIWNLNFAKYLERQAMVFS